MCRSGADRYTESANIQSLAGQHADMAGAKADCQGGREIPPGWHVKGCSQASRKNVAFVNANVHGKFAGRN